ncbi:DUF2231 domain-containing protein [Pseudomonas sp.]|jgi:uncharacterized membrane protein|uniref:DUF2231 domain-containing protein n=1 Tax=Pseudomonas sp. TaxID=306 RepID=UPI00272C80FF|nr:DUF2231 domain-containing protein [Pseudomonas sp.]
MQKQIIPSKMAIFGHPIHPQLVHFPVALLLSVVLTDILYIWSEDFFWARAGIWLAGAGALGAWVAGIVGMLDLVLVPAIRRLITAWSHAILAVMLISVASLNWLSRIAAPDEAIWPWGMYLSVLSALLIASAAFLGGILVYDHGVGVTQDKLAPPREQ